MRESDVQSREGQVSDLEKRASVSRPSTEQRAEWRKAYGLGMVSSVGEYTPDEFWEVLDALDEAETKNAELVAENARLRTALELRHPATGVVIDAAAWVEQIAVDAKAPLLVEVEKLRALLEALRHCPHGESGLCGDLKASEDNACAFCYSLAKNQRDAAFAEVERLKAELEKVCAERDRQAHNARCYASECPDPNTLEPIDPSETHLGHAEANILALELDLSEARRVMGELLKMYDQPNPKGVDVEATIASARKLVGGGE